MHVSSLMTLSSHAERHLESENRVRHWQAGYGISRWAAASRALQKWIMSKFVVWRLPSWTWSPLVPLFVACPQNEDLMQKQACAAGRQHTYAFDDNRDD